MVGENLSMIGMVVAFIASLILVVIVGASHAKRSVRRSFCWTLVASSLWIGSNVVYQVTGATGDIGYYSALWAYTFACWAVIAFLFFVAKFTGWNSLIIKITFVAGSIASCAMAIPGWIATGLSEGGIVTTPWIIFYGLVIVFG